MEYSSYDYDSEDFWNEDATATATIGPCHKKLSIIKYSQDCLLSEDFNVNIDYRTTSEEFFAEIISVIPIAVFSLILAVPIGMLYWPISHAIFRLLRYCFRRIDLLEKKESGTENVSDIPLLIMPSAISASNGVNNNEEVKPECQPKTDDLQLQERGSNPIKPGPYGATPNQENTEIGAHPSSQK